MSVLCIKTKEKNLVLSAILAIILLFPFLSLVPATAQTPITTTIQTEMLSNNASIELSSNKKDSASFGISFDMNLNETAKKNATQIIKADNSSYKMGVLESASGDYKIISK